MTAELPSSGGGRLHDRATARSAGYLVLSELFLPTKGGTAIWFGEVYRRMGGKEIHIVTADVPGAAAIDASHENTVHRLKLRRVTWLRPESLGIYGRLLAKSLALAFRHRFASVHAGRALPEGLVAWLVGRLRRVPVVVYAHGEELTTWGRSAKYGAMRLVLRRSDIVISNSSFTRDELIRMGVDPARIVLIHPGVDIHKFREGLPASDLRAAIGVQPSDKLVLSVGRLSRRKGFDMVVRSVAALHRQGLEVHYALIGIGEDREYLLDLARELGVLERVHFLGHVAADDLPRWYNACDVHAMPNREIDGDTEGFGIVFLEAAACGKPSIAGVAGGTASAVVDRETGLRVDGTREQAVTAALVSLLGDPVSAARLGHAGMHRVVERFSWEHVARATETAVAPRKSS